MPYRLVTAYWGGEDKMSRERWVMMLKKCYMDWEGAQERCGLERLYEGMQEVLCTSMKRCGGVGEG